MENNNITLLIAAFVALLIGVSLLSIIAQEGNSVRETVNVLNDSTINIAGFREDAGGGCNDSIAPVAIANPPTDWRTELEYGCQISNFVISTGNGTALTNGTHYVFYPNNGTWHCINTVEAADVWNLTNTHNTTEANYTYCPDGYLVQNWSRTMIGIVPGFFAIALIAVAIGLFYTILRKEGLMSI